MSFVCESNITRITGKAILFRLLRVSGSENLGRTDSQWVFFLFSFSHSRTACSIPLRFAPTVYSSFCSLLMKGSSATCSSIMHCAHMQDYSSCLIIAHATTKVMLIVEVVGVPEAWFNVIGHCCVSFQ